MKPANIKFCCLAVIAFSFSKANAQGFKFPLFNQQPQNKVIFKGYTPSNIPLYFKADSTKAIPLNYQANCTVYALPLDGTRCLVPNEPVDTSINAWKPDSNAGVAITIPNALELRNIIPQKTAGFSLLTK